MMTIHFCKHNIGSIIKRNGIFGLGTRIFDNSFELKYKYDRNNIIKLDRRSMSRHRGGTLDSRDRNNYALAVTDCNLIDTAFASRMFESLKLSSFSEEELKRCFDEFDVDKDGYLSRKELSFVFEKLKFEADNSKIVSSKEEIVDIFMKSFDLNNDGKISYDEFRGRMLNLAERRDPRVWPISGSMFVVGLSVGIMLPVMPQLVNQLGMSSADYGLVVSSYALAKLFGNVPAAFAVDKFGRKPILVLGVGMLGISMFGFSNSSHLNHLILCRLFGGLGVSAFSTAATMSITDMSTSLNRSRMMAPLVASFSAGSLMGPALGGPLVTLLGPSQTFYVVGAIFLANTMLIKRYISETMPAWRKLKLDQSRTVFDEIKDTAKQWGPLLRDRDLRSVCILNAAHWFNLSGASMTLLPLILVSDRFGWSPIEVGGVFAFQSGINVLLTPLSAKLIDQMGSKKIMPAAMLVVSVATGLFPYASTTSEALAVLGLWAVGGTMLGTAPSTYVANHATLNTRAQSLALLRTCGDLGILLGATTVGTLAVTFSENVAMQISSAFLFAVNMWFYTNNRK